MRSRTMREGSVGLLLLLGVGVVGTLFVWLRNLEFGERDYQLVVEFDNANQLVPGSSVRYRGVAVGQINSITPTANGVDVRVTIDSDLRIPRETLVQANQSGLIGETSIDFFPEESLSLEEIPATNPLSEECNSQIVLCAGDRIDGEAGASFERLIRATAEVTELFSRPEFYNNLNRVAENAGTAAREIAEVSDRLAEISTSAEEQLQTLTATANMATTQIGDTAAEVELLVANLNSALQENRGEFTQTLRSIRLSTQRLQQTLDTVGPTIEELSAGLESIQTQEAIRNLETLTADAAIVAQNLRQITDALDDPATIENIETLTANAAVTAANLRQVTEALGDPANVVTLQQTLDSARATFANTQKITADLDELTGSPEFRNNVRDIIDGLSGLLSSTQELGEKVIAATGSTPKEKSLCEKNPSLTSDCQSQGTENGE